MQFIVLFLITKYHFHSNTSHYGSKMCFDCDFFADFKTTNGSTALSKPGASLCLTVLKIMDNVFNNKYMSVAFT